MPEIVLQPSLTDDVHSRIHFTNWKKSLTTAAQSLCRSLDDCGAKSLVSDDPEWNSHPTNIITTTSAAGIITITQRARPVITRPVLYSGNEKRTAVINLFNYKELQWKEWTAASMALHHAMINSIGAQNLIRHHRKAQRTCGHHLVVLPPIACAHHHHLRYTARNRRLLHRKPHQRRAHLLRCISRFH